MSMAPVLLLSLLLAHPLAVRSSKSDKLEDILSSLDVGADGTLKESASSVLSGSPELDEEDNGFYGEVPTTHPYLRIVPYYPDEVYKEPVRVMDAAKLDGESFLHECIFENTPVIIKNAIDHWPALEKWLQKGYLRRKVGDSMVKVDLSHDNSYHFYGGLYHTEDMPFSEFLNCLKHKTAKKNPLFDWAAHPEINCYLAQNVIEKTLPALSPDIRYPEFARSFRLHEANFWMGAGGQRTPLHYDGGQNLYAVVAGTKSFSLFDPSQSRFLYPIARKNESIGFPLSSLIDLRHIRPDDERFPLVKHLRGFKVDLVAGDMLYLPAYWWHEVRSEGGPNIAVNFWFEASERIGGALLGYWEEEIRQFSPSVNRILEAYEYEISKNIEYPERLR